MVQPKAVIVASIVALTVLGGPLAANAKPLHNPESAPTAIHTDGSTNPNGNDGDSDSDDRKRGLIPPVFVIPGTQPPREHHHTHPQEGSVPGALPGNTGSGTSTGFDTTPGDNTATATTGPDDNTSTTANVKTGTSSANTDKDFVVVGTQDVDTANSIATINPKQANPVAIERVQVTRQTPADKFMEAAYIGLGLMALAALGMGASTVVRAVRLRRAGKGDYFYENK